MNITFGELEVVIYTTPWRMDVVDTASNPANIIISESSKERHRLVRVKVCSVLFCGRERVSRQVRENQPQGKREREREGGICRFFCDHHK